MQALSVVGLLLVAFFAYSEAATCPYSCTRSYSYSSYYSCGTWGWSRCRRTNYYTTRSTCYRTCVHGGFTSWREQSRSPCSVSCGYGQQTVRSTRTCTNPAPSGGGNPCYGDTAKSQIASCNPGPCPIDGGWTDWNDWQDYDECSVLCGGGKKDQYHTRTCTDPRPQYGGADCSGPKKQNQTVTCNEDECGDTCPENEDTYIASETNSRRYYHCSNNKAIMRQCAVGTMWDQETKGCINDPDAAPTTAAPVTHAPNNQCTSGYKRHESDCAKYYQCDNGLWVLHSCATGLYFDTSFNGCNFPANVQC